MLSVPLPHGAAIPTPATISLKKFNSVSQMSRAAMNILSGFNDMDFNVSLEIFEPCLFAPGGNIRSSADKNGSTGQISIISPQSLSYVRFLMVLHEMVHRADPMPSVNFFSDMSPYGLKESQQGGDAPSSNQ